MPFVTTSATGSQDDHTSRIRSLLAPFLQFFFAEHLIVHRRVSPETVASYRDTFRLLLQFLQRSVGKEPSRLTLADIQPPVILQFLDSLEQNRGNCARTRNVRLAAVRSFFRLLALRDPASVDVAARVLAIPVKRWDHRSGGLSDSSGNRRDSWRPLIQRPGLAAATMHYSSLCTTPGPGFRRWFLFSGISSATAPLPAFFDGKGPQGTKCALVAENRADSARLARRLRSEPAGLFTKRAVGLFHVMEWLTSFKQSVRRALPNCPSLATKRISPHVLRHTTAMHLLQSGVDITVIALWLGHESLETTHIYIEADLQMKQTSSRKGRTCGSRIPSLCALRRPAGLSLGTLIMPTCAGCARCYADAPSFYSA